ncbi:unnamed protein product [Ectocarpus sp. 12 AP-2014]
MAHQVGSYFWPFQFIFNSDGRHRLRCWIAGGAVASVLVVGAAILAVLFKAGRLKTRGSSR